MMTTQRYATIRMGAAMIILAASTLATATVTTWDDDAGDGDWFNPQNWWWDVVPEVSDDIRIGDEPGAAAKPVTIDGDGEITLTNPDFEFADLRVGDLGAGTVESTGGAVATTFTRLARQRGSTGNLSIYGGTWMADEFLAVGASGSGTLSVYDGASAQSGAAIMGLFHRSQGSATIAGSDWICDDELTVGMYSDALLEVVSGGSVMCRTAVIGFGERSEASVEVNSGGALAAPEGLIVGYSGEGELLISDGTLDSGVAVVGGKWDLMGPGEGTVEMEKGSRWTCTSDIFIGESGDGTVKIKDTSEVICRDGYVAHGEGIEAVLALWNEASWRSDNLFIGTAGDGFVNVYGGAMIIAERLYVGRRPAGVGSLAVHHGRLTVGQLHVGNGGPGTLSVPRADAEIEITDALVLGNDALIDSPDAGFVPAIHMNGASLKIKATDSSSTLTALEQYHFDFDTAEGEIATLEAAGSTPHEWPDGTPQWDPMSCFGLGAVVVGANGPARVRLVDETDNMRHRDDAVFVRTLEITPGSVLELNGIDVYYITLINNGGVIIPSGGSLYPIGKMMGDVDDDGDVDLDDLVLLKQNFNTPDGAMREQGDLNGDGAVDMDDFVILKQNFGN